MKQVADSAGNPIKGLFRQKDGSLVVLDAALLNNSIREQEHLTEIQTLKNRVTELEFKVKEILEKINGN